MVAEELLVEDPMGVFGTDVDVYEGSGEESVRTGSALGRDKSQKGKHTR